MVKALKEEYAELQKMLEHKSLLAEVASTLNAAESFENILDGLLKMISREMGIERTYLYGIDSQFKTAVPLSCWDVNCKCKKHGDLTEYPCSLFPRITERLMRGKNFISHNTGRLNGEEKEFFRKRNIGAVFIAPVGSGNLLMGFLCISRGKTHYWDFETYHIINKISDMIAKAWERDIRFKARLDAEKQRLEAIKIAETASRLASIGTLAAGIAHEINQPLNALKLKVDGMLYMEEENKTELPKNVFKNLQTISEQADRINKIITQMRTLAWQEKGRKQIPVKINEIIKQAIALVKRKLTVNRIKVKTTLSGSLPLVSGCPTQMEQVIINLVVNAIHALASQTEGDRILSISTFFADGNCILKVADNGPGIPEEHINHIFDSFFTTNMSSDGMGLGLAIVQNFVVGMSGRIIAENNKDGGACFTISLPAVIS